jgi:CheY-specific phosphatase CheX
METNLVGAFSSAIKQIFEEIGHPEVSVRERVGPTPAYDMLGSVGLVGQLHGCFLLRFGRDSLTRFVSALTRTTGLHDVNPSDPAYTRSVVGEFANQLCGRCMMSLSEIGIDCLITPPTVISGKDIGAAIPGLTDILELDISDGFGTIGFFIGLKK